MAATNGRRKKSWECIHVATFVSQNGKLGAHNIKLYMKLLDQKLATSSHCELLIMEGGIELKFKIQRRTLFINWQKIINSGEINASKAGGSVLFFLQRKHSGFDLLGMNCETYVLKSNVKDDFAYLSEAISERHGILKSQNKMTEQAVRVPGDRRSSLKTSPDPQYGESMYMLNRCLDDIEHNVKKLKKYLWKQTEPSVEGTTTSRSIAPPAPEETTEAVQKAKFTLNLTESLKDCAPDAFKKVFIRLITFIDWLDDLCHQHKLIATYTENLVRDVIEPLLQRSTLSSIKSLMDGTLEEKWVNLGPAWNTPMEEWPNRLDIYMPRFRTLPKYVNTIGHGWRDYNSRDAKIHRNGLVASELTGDSLMVEITKPVIPNRQYAEDFESIQNQGGLLCFATIPHFGSKRQELTSDQGEIFELLDDSRQSWWQVRNYRGQTGYIPSWKLRSFQMTPDILDDRTPLSYASGFTQMDLFKDFSPTDRRSRPFSTWSQRDRFRPHSSGPLRRDNVRDLEVGTEGHVQPLLVYIPSERLEENRPVSLLLLPCGNRSRTIDSTIVLSPQKIRRYESQSMLDSLTLSGQASSTLWKDHLYCWHPRVSGAYKPTIKLDRKNSVIMGKV